VTLEINGIDIWSINRSSLVSVMLLQLTFSRWINRIALLCFWICASVNHLVVTLSV